MTTDLQVKTAANVFVGNDVLHIRPGARTAGLRLAGAAWLATGLRPQDAHRRSLNHAVSLLTARIAGYGVWLLACHSAWQADSRIVRHRKLWGALRAGGLAKPFGHDAGEGLVKGPAGLRFFGAVQLGLGSLEPVVAILEAEPASHLVALKLQDEAIVKTLVGRGWDPPRTGPNADVLTAVCAANGVLFWPVGAFDDREAGCVALATAPLIDALLQ